LKKFSLMFTAALLVLAANNVYASTPQACAEINGGDAGGAGGTNTDYVNNLSAATANIGCNVLITFGALGAVTTTNPNSAISYDAGDDDNLVGIVNNSGSTINNIMLTANTTPFEFDGDGACDSGWDYSASGAGGTSPCGGAVFQDGGTYAPAGVTFSGISGDFDTGTITFAGGIANGGTAWFSLEGPVALNIGAMANVPEPSSIVLFGSVLVAAAWKLRRRVKG
jgi:hypothetical protein